MIIILSPSKKQSKVLTSTMLDSTQPVEIDNANFLMKQLKQFSIAQLSKMMKVSENIAKNTYQSIKNFSLNDQNNQLQSIFLFQGDAFQKLHAQSMNHAELLFAQNHLIILSALYGYLRPLDVVQPYRLDMTDPLVISDNQNLTHYWRDTITTGLNNLLSQQKTKVILNLASSEYFNAIDLKKLSAKVVYVDFKVCKNDQYKTVGIYAKRGRGSLARYIIDKKIDTPEAILEFAAEGFRYSKLLSKPDHSVITFVLVL